jgi:DNA-binding SARP family transcriptional activator/tetratricopeptide (TPR) repeat protein
MKTALAISFCLLGPLKVEINGTPAGIKSARQRIVLARLLMTANRVVEIDQFVDAVWPDDPPSSARGQIQICVSSLRRLFGDPQIIQTHPGGYSISVDAAQLDVVLFDAQVERAREAASKNQLAEASACLDRALGLWYGSVLSDVSAPIAKAYAHRLEERRLLATEDRIDLRLRMGMHRELVDELVELTAVHPLREQLWAFLMLALYRSERQADALAVYRTARQNLIDELGIEPSEKLRALESAILTQDSSLHSVPSPETATEQPQPPVKPQQLLSDIPDFTGRSADVERLVGYLTRAGDGGRPSPSVPIAIITGAGGSGKTTLAMHVAHLVKDDFPDGALFCQMQGSTYEPRSSVSVIGSFLRALGVPPGVVPAEPEERAALLRSTLAGRRLVIVLDDVASESQIVSLLPALAGPAVIATSRSRLAGIPGSLLIEAGTLTDQEGLELLGRVCGEARIAAEQQAVMELISLCGGLPLALRIAGVRLSAHLHWSVQALVRRLKDEHCRLDELVHGGIGVRSVLSHVYDSLSEPAKLLFRLLSSVTMSRFSSWPAAALLDCGADEASTLLDELADARLLEVSVLPASGRPCYRFHDLVRIFAKEMLDQHPADWVGGIARVLSGMLTLAEEARLRLHGEHWTAIRGTALRRRGLNDELLEGVQDPLTWIDEEWPNIEPGVRQAAELGFDELCWELATAAVTGYEAFGWFDEWRSTHEVALEATSAAGNLRGQAAVLASLGSLGLAQHSQDYTAGLHRALRLFETVEDELGQAVVFRNIAHLDRLQGRLEDAVKRYERALHLFRSQNDVGAQCHVLSGQARTYLDLGLLAQAEELAKASLTLGSRLDSRRLEAQALYRLGEVFIQESQAQAAKEVFQRTLELTRLLGDRVGQSYALNGLGDAALSEDLLDEAHHYFSQTVEICRSADERNAHAHAMLGLGLVSSRLNALLPAEQFLLHASAMFDRQGNDIGRTRARRELDNVRARQSAASLASDAARFLATSCVINPRASLEASSSPSR